MKTLTIDEVKTVLDTRFGGLLFRGAHVEGCKVCAMELRAACLDLAWDSCPDGLHSPTNAAARALNDALWSSDEARTLACLPLVCLSDDSAPSEWVNRYVDAIIREILPVALRAAASEHSDARQKGSLLDAAHRCSNEGLPYAEEAARAAWYAASSSRTEWVTAAARTAWDAARTARCAREAGAAWPAGARSASWAVARVSVMAAMSAGTRSASGDEVLRLGVKILLRAHGRDDLVQQVKAPMKEEEKG